MEKRKISQAHNTNEGWLSQVIPRRLSYAFVQHEPSETTKDNRADKHND